MALCGSCHRLAHGVDRPLRLGLDLDRVEAAQGEVVLLDANLLHTVAFVEDGPHLLAAVLEIGRLDFAVGEKRQHCLLQTRRLILDCDEQIVDVDRDDTPQLA